MCWIWQTFCLNPLGRVDQLVLLLKKNGFLLHHYHGLVGTYEGDESSICLDRRSIDAIAHSQDPELYPVPEDRFLSGDTLTRLSNHFKMNVYDFFALSMI
ncbi:hypothetical protein BD770DRAFT_392422 [Pilaira anomala]|nr:hypothetical protein BD770DRAFT_392422 [Pilaira anomala]